VRCKGSMKKATCDWFSSCLSIPMVSETKVLSRIKGWIDGELQTSLQRRNAQSPKVENLGMTCSRHIDVLDRSWQARKSSCGGYWRGTVSLFGHSLFSSCMQLLNFFSISWVASHQLEES
jgi:hypothetical protein